eukprot:466811-Rhodomonas_salina.1
MRTALRVLAHHHSQYSDTEPSTTRGVLPPRTESPSVPSVPQLPRTGIEPSVRLYIGTDSSTRVD